MGPEGLTQELDRVLDEPAKAPGKKAAELAQLRQQAVDGHAQADFSAKETELLDRITSLFL